LSFQQDHGLPFQADLIRGLESLGFVNETTAVVENRHPRLPKFPPDQPPRNAIGIDDLLIGFGIYLAVKISDTVIDEISGDIYDGIVRPRLSTFWKQLTATRRGQRLVASFDHWFEGSGVLVRVEFYTSSSTHVPPDVTHVAHALRLAAKYLADKGVTHRVLAFEVRNGRMNDEPRLSEPLP
jgi:hypothetical protein